MLEVKHIVGLDLGQVSDYTALVSLRKEQEVPEPPKPRALNLADAFRKEALIPSAGQNPSLPRYYCNVAERFRSDYLRVTDNVCRLFQDSRFQGQTLVVDGTGVGRPVVDIIRKSRPNCRLIPVTITAGTPNAALKSPQVDEWGYWHVPKKELVGSVQVLLGTSRLEVAPGLREAGTLAHELKSFSYKIRDSGHTSLEAWREQDHDDLVLAVALAAWWGERGQQELWVR